MRHSSKDFIVQKHKSNFLATDKQKLLYRIVNESVKRINDSYKKESIERSLFSTDALIYRTRLKQSLVKLVFMDPVEYGRKAEELLWRKVFYDVIVHVKRLLKSATFTSSQSFDLAVRSHLQAGVGFYQQLCLRIQLDTNLGVDQREELGFCLDFGRWESRVSSAQLVVPTSFHEKNYRILQHRETSSDLVKEWALHAVHRCLIYIGDLYRYQYDFKDDSAKLLAQRYYNHAVQMFPSIGLPHNQLGTLHSSAFYNLLSIYHYMRCLACDVPFDGARANLRIIFEHNAKRYRQILLCKNNSVEFCEKEKVGSKKWHRVRQVKQFLVNFIHLISQLSQPSQAVAAGAMALNEQCQVVLSELNLCMFLIEDGSCSTTPDAMKPDWLPDGLVFQLVLICLLTLHNLDRAGGAQHLHLVTAFVLAVFDNLLNHTVTRLTSAMAMCFGSGAEAALLLPSSGSSSDEESVDKQCSSTSIATTAVSAASPRRAARLLRRRRRHVNVELQLSESEDLSECDNHPIAEVDMDEDSDGSLDLIDYSEEDDEDDEDEEEEEEGGDESEKTIELFLQRNNVVSARTMTATTTPKQVELQPENNQHDTTAASRTMEEEWREAANALRTSGLLTSHRNGGGAPFFSSSVFPNIQQVDDEEDVLMLHHQQHLSSETVKMVENEKEVQQQEESQRVLAQLNLMSRAGLLPCIKVLCDWMKGHPNVMTRAVAAASESLWNRMAVLLNILPMPEVLLRHKKSLNLPAAVCERLAEASASAALPNLSGSGLANVPTMESEPFMWRQTFALPEDNQLRGFPPLALAHGKLDYRTSMMPAPGSRLAEVAVRVHCLQQFGRYAASVGELDFLWDRNIGFMGPSQAIQIRLAENKERQNRFMGKMAELRLKSEVDALEGTIEGGGDCSNGVNAGDCEETIIKSPHHRRQRTLPTNNLPLSPYVVPDTDVLCNHLSAMRELANCHRFIIIVPQAVIRQLDLLKKQRATARNAIRFLESETRRGNPRIRLQRPNESESEQRTTKALVLTSEGSRTSLDCARYFARKTGAHGIVTILTEQVVLMPSQKQQQQQHPAQQVGSSSSAEEINSDLFALYEEALKDGILVEGIDSFMNRWHTSLAQ